MRLFHGGGPRLRRTTDAVGKSVVDHIWDGVGQDERARPCADLKDVFTRPPTQPASRIEELLPHFWQSAIPH